MGAQLYRTAFLAGAILLALLPGLKIGHASDASATLASRSDTPPVSPGASRSRRASATQTTKLSSDGEPFGRRSLQVGNGPLALTWQAINARMRADMASVALCSIQKLAWSDATRNLRRIVEEARTHDGLAGIGQINRAINLAIKPAVTAYWQSALETLSAGTGDRKNYSVAKYLALREAGFSECDVKLVIVHDTAAHQDHAIITVLFDGSWYVLDNRWLALVHDFELRHADPLYILDESGMRRFGEQQAASRPLRFNAHI